MLFRSGKVSADLEIKDKYSTIVFNDTRKVKANLYNSKLNGNNAGDINIESKYSRISFASCGLLYVNGYNDKYEIPKTGNVTFTAKYSDLYTSSSGNMRINIYNGSIVTNNAVDVEIISKYAEYRFESAERCKVSSSYNDNFTAGGLISMSIDESKYSNYKIDGLGESVDDRNGYSDSFVITVLENSFKGLVLNGKYGKATLSIPKNISFRFKASIKYPEFDINEQTFKPIVKIIDGSDVKYDAIKGTESDGMPVIEVNGYSMTLKILEM